MATDQPVKESKVMEQKYHFDSGPTRVEALRELLNPLVPVVCLECGKKFKVRAQCATGPECPKCGGTDVDVR